MAHDDVPPSLLHELQQLAWNRNKRWALERQGLTVSPVTFYSGIPSIQESIDSFEYRDGAAPPYLDRRLFDDERMRAELASLQPFTFEFQPPAHGDELN